MYSATIVQNFLKKDPTLAKRSVLDSNEASDVAPTHAITTTLPSRVKQLSNLVVKAQALKIDLFTTE